jgi:NifU-like protein involved in Fe-S cluster formation
LGAEHDCHEINARSDFKVLPARRSCLLTPAAATKEGFKNVTESAAATEWV